MAKILVAGQDLRNLDTVRVTIESVGHDTVTALDGLDAFEKAITEAPDIIFLETTLDTYDGFETCRMLRDYPDVSQTLPIIFLAGENVNPYKMDAAGATDQLPKNHLSIDLMDMLIKYLGPNAVG